MAEKLKVYRCNICGNVVEVLHSGVGVLVCCGKPMDSLKEKTKGDEGKEKHVPVIERTGRTVKVKIGSIPHPMEEKHYIEWISITVNGKVYRKFLNPGDKPEAEFEVETGEVEAKAYCNIHGLWSSA